MTNREELILNRYKRIKERGFLRYFIINGFAFGILMFFLVQFDEQIPISLPLLAVGCLLAGMLWASSMWLFLMWSYKRRSQGRS